VAARQPGDNRVSTVTHIAGPAVTVGGRTIQRCCICGEKLIDSLGRSTPLDPEGNLPQCATYQVWAMVQHEGSRWSVTGNDGPASDQYPADGCIDLVEA
jgi:hypothetical protein